jgi:proteasome lid subunit RPN8/RPN11
MTFILTAKNISDIKAHTIRDFPKEACGLIVDGDYLPCFNYATDPNKDFTIAAALQVKLKTDGKKIEAVVHSHPGGPLFPTDSDMIGQLATGVPWVLIATDGEITSTPEIWGGNAEIAPILGRSFMHGIRDCYSLARDTYGLGKEKLAQQSVLWPLESIILPEFPRADGWWGDTKKLGQTLYVDNFKKAGFVEIPREEAKPGDAFLMKIRSLTLNHCGILTSDGTIIHHLPGRLSHRTPAGIWARAAEIWVRYKGTSGAS